MHSAVQLTDDAVREPMRRACEVVDWVLGGWRCGVDRREACDLNR